MARVTKNEKLEPVINAAQEWVRNCLIADNSVFSNGPLWTPDNVAEVHRAFVDHPDEGDESFSTKLKGQMGGASPSANRLMAEMIWALLLFPSNIKESTKRKQVGDIWSMSGEGLREDHPLLREEVLAGIGSGGPGFNNHRWRELVFLIALTGDLKKRSLAERQHLLYDYDAFVGWIVDVPQEGDRQFRHMLRYFCFPDRVERMSSNRERWAVLTGFGVATEKEVKKWSDRRLDDELLTLRNSLQNASPSEVLDFYEDPLRDRWRESDEATGGGNSGGASKIQTEEPIVAFSAEECAVFDRYPNSVSWNDVSQSDRGLFNNVWAKLKQLSQHLATSSKAGVRLKAETSHYVPNGRSPKEIWSCVYPATISNKSYSLQIALIISGRGAEVCFCMGSGTSQVTSAKKQDLEVGLEVARKALGSASKELIVTTERAQRRKWFYRKSWLADSNHGDFATLTEWLSYASSREGSGASISLYFSPTELEGLETKIFSVFSEALETYGPILKAVYTKQAGGRYWLFQGNADDFDIDSYLRNRQEIRWTVRQFKESIQVGDKVLMWKSGSKGGVVAVCTVIAPPSNEIPEDAPELWKKQTDSRSGETRCKLRVVESFVEAPISRDAIRTNFPELLIIKSPQGTNFEITEAEYEGILNIDTSTPVSLPFDNSALSLALEAIEATHMRIDREFLSRFVTSLAAKPFLILTGNSGTGKTKLAELFVRWLCRDAKDRCALVPVGADWTDNRNVLGFVNHLRSTTSKDAGAEIDLPVYQTTKILDLLLDAARRENERSPLFLILDEMNLSHVERYFADFLSAMESNEGRMLLHREGRPLPRRPGGPCDVPESLPLPRNVFVIGTVNVDETTYMFSPKVLDRANVIEFRVGSDAPLQFLKSGGQGIGDIAHASAGYAEGFLELSFRARGIKGAALALVANPDVPPEGGSEGMETCRTTIADLFALMQKRHQEFAFRSMAEILRFLAVDFEFKAPEQNWNWRDAMDAQILQKVLPKLHGTKRKIGSLLAALAKYCEQGVRADAEGLLVDETKAEAYLAAEDKRENSPAFKESYIKLCEMIEAVRRDQFVSFIQ